MKVDGKTVKLQIWDTAGQERFRTITSAYYRGADGVILVYDVTHRESYDHVREWLSEVNKLAPEGTPKLIIGNKSDRSDRVVSTEEGRELGKELKIEFIETSARNSDNVSQAFVLMASQLIEKHAKLSGGEARTSGAVDVVAATGGKRSRGSLSKRCCS